MEGGRGKQHTRVSAYHRDHQALRGGARPDKRAFSVRKGEIHAILGENGAGKSTLVKILMGEQAPDAGRSSWRVTEIRQFSPLARSLGIQMVHQELAIFENMTVAENIYPWNDFRTKTNTVDWKRMNGQARARLKSLGLDAVQPDQLMRNLTLDAQQIVEILAA